MKAGRGHQLNRGIWGSFQCADGRWLVLAGAGGERFARLMEVTGLKEAITSDPRLSTPEARNENRDLLWRTIENAMRKHTRDEWLELLAKHDLVGAPVQTYAEVLEDEQAWANDYLLRIEHPEAGPIDVVGSPIHMTKTEVDARKLPPELGQHTEEVLLQLGYDWDAIARLREAGAI
jgi:crotonobetainyl-CoA:carnitine CoA-transferase CaiB-like acyl-CoA transferase